MTKKKKSEDLLKKGAPVFPYTKEMAEQICLLIAVTPHSINRICAENPKLPKARTIYSWLVKHPEFSQMYFDARKYQALVLADSTLDIADDSRFDTIDGENGESKLNSEWVARCKLKIANIHWHCARLLPKIFGEKDAEQEDLKKTVEQLTNEIELLKKHEKPY